MPGSTVRTRRWSRIEYERLVDLGAETPVFRRAHVATPLAAPRARIAVGDLLP